MSYQTKMIVLAIFFALSMAFHLIDAVYSLVRDGETDRLSVFTLFLSFGAMVLAFNKMGSDYFTIH